MPSLDMTTGRKKRAAMRARPRSTGSAPVNAALLAPYNSYGEPAFVQQGCYLDKAFRCENCGRDEVWTATQQKWWYEVAKGYVYSMAKLCRACRALVRAQREESRRVHLEGKARRKP